MASWFQTSLELLHQHWRTITWTSMFLTPGFLAYQFPPLIDSWTIIAIFVLHQLPFLIHAHRHPPSPEAMERQKHSIRVLEKYRRDSAQRRDEWRYRDAANKYLRYADMVRGMGQEGNHRDRARYNQAVKTRDEYATRA